MTDVRKFRTLVGKLRKKPDRDLLIALILMQVVDKVAKKKTKKELKVIYKDILQMEEEEFNELFKME